jgi:hypothetical protein
MTHPSKTLAQVEKELTEAICRAVPGIDPDWYCRECLASGSPTLEDVLRALPEKEITYSKWSDEFHIRKKDRLLCGAWKIGKSLSDQSEETKRFIHSVLV